MAALATDLAALSNKADELLEIHHQQLFAWGLDVSFNRATLATKYWLPLPESLKSTDSTAAHEDEHPQDDSDEQIHLALEDCKMALRRFEWFVISQFRKTPPNAVNAFAQSVREISRLIDAHRQSSDPDSDSSRPGSSQLYTQDAGEAETRESTQLLTDNTQTYGPTEFDIRKRPSSSARDENDMLSSPRGSHTQLHPPKPQKDDTSQSPYSHRLPIPMGTSSASPSPESSISGKDHAPEDQYGHSSMNPATGLAIRPRSIKALPTVSDHTTNQLDAERKEYIPKEIDPSGETKVSKEGFPLEGRVFRCRTFQLPDRGETIFMLGSDCARILGYRDSDLLFNDNRSLFKIILTRSEKIHLSQSGITNSLFPSQQTTVVTARSMFRRFGARLVWDGRRVRDGYWEAKAREQGFTEEDAADRDGSGLPKAGEAVVAGAGSFAFKDSLESLNIRDENTRKQGSTEEDAAGSPGTHHDSHSGFGSEPPAAVPAVSSVPNSSPSFVSVSSSAKGGSTTNSNNNALGIDGIGQLTYQRAIDIARNTEGDLDPSVTTYLEDAITEITNNLESYPDSYLLSKDEFAVFNYSRQRFTGEIAERAIDRYWRSTHAGEQQQ